ncbi:hypothetical protein [Photobacterium leiognathi]|uniref:hypothetical protein n=1 Tax=Photobacterium leiognathi TaxID=553611 RepID=UPI002738E807|nr:hypothetical protein [Photobacterium leiognathi]
MATKVLVITVLADPEVKHSKVNQFLVVNSEIVSHTDDVLRTALMAKYVKQGVTEFEHDAFYLAQSLKTELQTITLDCALALADYIDDTALTVNPDSVFQYLFEYVDIEIHTPLKRHEQRTKHFFGVRWTVQSEADLEMGDTVTLDLISTVFSDRILVLKNSKP